MTTTRKKKVLIVGQLASFAGAGPLADVFRALPDWDVTLIAGQRDNLDFAGIYKAKVLREMSWRERWQLRREVRKTDLTVIVATPGFETWIRILLVQKPRKAFRINYVLRMAPFFAGMLNRHTTAVLLSDSYVLSKPARVNSLLRMLPGIHVFAMPDLIPMLARSTVYPFYPGTGLPKAPDPRAVRDKPLTGHSPSMKQRYSQKGTQFILDVFDRNEVNYDLISGLPYDEALQRKSQLDVFVDQIASVDRFPKTTWHGGIGKSGLEAMALGCAVVTSGTLADTEPYMPMPPVLMSDRDRFEDDLRALLADPDRIARMGREGRTWFEAHATPEAQVRKILENTGFADSPQRARQGAAKRISSI